MWAKKRAEMVVSATVVCTRYKCEQKALMLYMGVYNYVVLATRHRSMWYTTTGEIQLVITEQASMI